MRAMMAGVRGARLALVNWTIHRLLDWQKAMVRAEAARMGAADPFAAGCPQIIPVRSGGSDNANV